MPSTALTGLIKSGRLKRGIQCSMNWGVGDFERARQPIENEVRILLLLSAAHGIFWPWVNRMIKSGDSKMGI